jgi:photosystem II stability/assembly factor-like uncharacterized protein
MSTKSRRAARRTAKPPAVACADRAPADPRSGQRLRTSTGRPWLLGLLGLVAIAAMAIVGYLAFGGPGSGPGRATAWATLGTRDVHSLAFVPGDSQHLFFGHHTGLLESRDGGRSWQPRALSGSDAMNVRPALGNTLQVAGHNLYVESVDGGAHWASVPNDLPGLDLHAFIVDPADLKHAWAWSVGYGLFESTDAGRHWTIRQSGDWPVLTAIDVNGKAGVLGVSNRGLARSMDGGVSWTLLANPGGQVASLTASSDGVLLYAGTSAGLQRSDDGGQTWRTTAFTGLALTVAMVGPNTVALVDDATRFFRSDDGGATFGPPQ